jgi:hypothetical protein
MAVVKSSPLRAKPLKIRLFRGQVLDPALGDAGSRSSGRTPQSRPMCLACGSRGVTVVFEAPTKHNAESSERAGAHRVICKAFFNGRGSPAPDQEKSL